MDQFHYKDGKLFCEGLAVADLADKYGTPLYVYSQASIVGVLKSLQTAFAELDPLVCYSVKANSNLSILKVMAEHGSGFDVVSAGELYRVQRAGGNPNRAVFAGVGKTDEEIAAGLKAGVLMFNVESEAELEAIVRVAQTVGKVAPLALRVNPDVDPKTHRYISTGKKESKFGMDIDRSLALGKAIKGNPHVKMIGVHMHIGSQITTTDPYAGAAGKAVTLIGQFREMGHPISWFNMGGGFGINYKKQEARAIEDFARVIVPAIKPTGCRLTMEPGRVIAGNSGILVSRVLYTKQSGEKRFLIQDAAMNDLIRPALYESFHRIWPVSVPAGFPAPPDDFEAEIPGTSHWDVVGPVCESGDFLAKDRNLPPLDRGDLLAVFSAGAYGMVMASNYNTRPRAAEILVNGSNALLARRRETYEDLVEQELAALSAPGALG
jgi:diaminopimelate decarboxylase